MKKIFLLFTFVAISLSNVLAYDFSAISPTGQTLYYNIIEGNAEITYQNSSSPRYLNLSGTLEIPSSVTYDGITFSVTTIGEYAFEDCNNLTSITIPNTLTTIGRQAFAHCSDLTSVTIPNSVTSIGGFAFYGCSSLTDVAIPNSVTSIGEYAFLYCSSLTNVNIPNSVTEIQNYAFLGTAIYNDNTNWINGVLYIDNCLIRTDPSQVPSSYVVVEGTRLIAEGAFPECSSLVSVTIPNSVTSIGRYAFHGCSNLTSVSMPNSITTIKDGVFLNCRNLTSVTIPNSVTSIGNSVFYGCWSLTSMTIPNSVISIGEHAFLGLGLTNITIPNSVISIGTGAFFGFETVFYCGNASGSPWGAIRAVCAGEEAFIFEDDAHTILQAYLGTDSIVTIPNSVTTIENSAFLNCGDLTCITIPNSVTHIGGYAFYGCGSLTSVNYTGMIDEWCGITFEDIYSNPLLHSRSLLINNQLVTDAVIATATEIKPYAFNNCGSLTSVTIPNSVTSIGSQAFFGCSNLTEITSEARVAPQLGLSAFYGVTRNIPVNIPCGTRLTYESNWNTYFSNFIGDDGFTFEANSIDPTMGYVTVLTQPICTNPLAEVIAEANPGYLFAHWSDGTTQNPYSLTLTTDVVLTAYFAVEVRDTVFVNDTTIVNNYIHDTTIVVDSIPYEVFVHDTTIVVDSIPYAVHDTTYIDVFIHDTTIV